MRRCVYALRLCKLGEKEKGREDRKKREYRLM
jgi:hypothetical protein